MTITISTADTTIPWGVSGKHRIVQNVLNIFRTKKLEVPFMREMGVDVEYIDNVLPYVHSNLISELIELCEKYEPRARVVDATITQDDNGNLIITAELEV